MPAPKPYTDGLMPRSLFILKAAIDTFVLLAVVTTGAYVLAINLHALGGDRRWTRQCAAAGILALVLFLLGVSAVVLASDGGGASSLVGVLWQGLLVGWAAEIVMLFQVGRNGWRDLQRRPHPFLVN